MLACAYPSGGVIFLATDFDCPFSTVSPTILNGLDHMRENLPLVPSVIFAEFWCSAAVAPFVRPRLRIRSAECVSCAMAS